MTATPRRLYIETVGCQMNVLDSEMVIADLRRRGYVLTDDPHAADALLFNTCAIREQAENKTYSALGRLKEAKVRDPAKVIGVMGCMAQKDQRLIFERAPFVDLIVGPGQLAKVPELIEAATVRRDRYQAISLERTAGSRHQIARSHETFDPLRDPAARPHPHQAYLRIQIGCDKFCTYCVVPGTRGPEQGRHPDEILAEARLLVDQGVKEIILLGQTVNSYRHLAGDGAETRLADLLMRLQDVAGLVRIKFVTNYPKDMTSDLLMAVRDLSKVSPYLHVPLQSGSDAVLKRMKRGYSVDDYRDMMARIDQYLPDAAVSSDFIVGFCGETEAEFQQTCDLVRECRFKNSFIFKYSERPGTKAAARLSDDIPHPVKQRRNNELLSIQNEISEAENRRFLGRTVEVLVEGRSKLSDKLGDKLVGKNGTATTVQMTGRTHCDRIVVFDGTDEQAGRLMPILIHDTTGHTLFGGTTSTAGDATSPDQPALVTLAT